MSSLTQQINAKVGGVLKVPYGAHAIDEPVTVRCAVVAEHGASIAVTHPITMASNSAWTTEGGRHSITRTGASNLFTIAGSAVEVSRILTDEQGASAGWTFMVDCAQSRENLRISKIKTYGSLGLIADNSGAGTIVDMRLDDVMSRLHRGRGSYLTKAFAYIFLRQCTVDYIASPSPALTNVPAWAFMGTEGLDLDSVDVLGTAITGTTPSQYGFYFDNVRALTIKQAMADNVGGFGFYFKNCNWVDASILKASMCADACIVATGTTQNVRVGDLYVCGRVGLPSNPGAALLWADSTVSNIHADQLLAERYSTLYGGYAQQKFTASKIVLG